MKLFHRLLATVGLAALIGPPLAEAAQRRGPVPAAPALPGVELATGAELEFQLLDRAFADAFAGRPVDPAGLAPVVRAMAAEALAAAPAGTPPAAMAGGVARRLALLLTRAGLAPDAATSANLASEIVAALERALKAQGHAVDRVALATAALGGFSPGTTPALATRTAATTTARDIGEPRTERLSAY